MTKWGIFVATIFYLTFTGWKTTSALEIKPFIAEFWFNWLVLPLLLMSMVALPPLPCYVGDEGIVTLIGVVLSVVIGFCLYARNSYILKQRGGGDGGDGTEVAMDEDGRTSTMEVVVDAVKREEEEEEDQPMVGGIGSGFAGHIVMESTESMAGHIVSESGDIGG